MRFKYKQKPTTIFFTNFMVDYSREADVLKKEVLFPYDYFKSIMEKYDNEIMNDMLVKYKKEKDNEI